MTRGKTYNKSSRRRNHKATKSKTKTDALIKCSVALIKNISALLKFSNTAVSLLMTSLVHQGVVFIIIAVAILRSAKLVATGKMFRLYRKSGGEAQAYKDFEFLAPKVTVEGPVSFIRVV